MSREKSVRIVMSKDMHNQTKSKGSLQYGTVHPAWHSFIVFCKTIRYGEIEKLKIQDGLPVLAEVARKKIKFLD
jgi:hypothetical protein